MVCHLGCGLSPLSTPRIFTLDLTSALTSDYTYTRADTVATYRDSDGKLQVASSNAPRFDHDSNGLALGLLIEGSIQNKLASYNANPADTTGWSKGGDDAATLTAVNDPSSYLSGAELDQTCTGGKLYKLDNSGGSADAYAESSATFGSTSVHTISAYIVASTGTAKLTRSGTSPESLAIVGGLALTRAQLTLTPSGSSDKMRILAPAGSVAYFILAQMEQNPFATSVIITAGAAATRRQDVCYIDSINSKTWWNEKNGAIAVRYISAGDMGATQYLAEATDGSSSNESVGLRIDSSGYDLKADIRSGNASLASGDTGTLHSANRLTNAAITWRPDAETLLGQGNNDSRSFSGAPSGVTRLNIGARNGGANPLFGWIQEIKISKHYKAPSCLGGIMKKNGDSVVLAGGQSLASGHFSSQSGSLDTGRQQFINSIGGARPTDAIAMVNGATGSSAASKTSNATNYWWDLSANARGPALDTFYANYVANGLTPSMILWAQGEEDSHHIGVETTKAQYKAALQAIFADMRATFGDIPVFLQRIGIRTGGYTNDANAGIQIVRDVQQEMIDENAWVLPAAEIYDVSLYDDVHPTAAGYGIIALRAARKMLAYLDASISGVNGPSVASASRSGTSITVTIAHDGGTDFTPSSGIEGFHFFDDASEITISSAVRTDATTITLTLSSAPTSGNETLYYIYDAELTLNTANTVKDDAATSMPLRSAKIVLAAVSDDLTSDDSGANPYYADDAQTQPYEVQ